MSAWSAVLMVLFSCDEPDIRKTSSRTAACVNGEEILAQQTGSVLARDNNSVAPEHAGRADAPSRKRLNREISKFYEDNPALFGQRRIYRVVDLAVAVAPEQSAELQNAVAEAKDLAEVVRWLDTRKLPFEAAIYSRAAEQIPMNILRRLFEMRDGQMAVVPTRRGTSIVRLEQSVAAPLSEKQAQPAIALYLHNHKRLELARAEVEKKMGERAQIDHDHIEPVRWTVAARKTQQAQPRVARPGTGRDTTGIASLK